MLVSWIRADRGDAGRGSLDDAAAILAEGAAALARAGAELLVLCTNTMHVVADRLGALPLLHIADPTAEAIRARGFGRIALLGTRFTMERGFYRDRLAGHGIEAIVPGDTDRAAVHRIIYEELCLGRIEATSRVHCQRSRPA